MEDLWGLLEKFVILLTLRREIPVIVRELKTTFPTIKKSFKKLLKQIK